MRPVQTPSRPSLLVLLVVSTAMACVGEMPPPPELKVTSPDRGLVQGGGGRVTVEGIARPGVSGSKIARVEVNDVPATVDADGSFVATVDVADGATLLKTVAVSEEGGAAIDARAVHAGELRPVGSTIERAVIASLSAQSFARLAEAAGPAVQSMNLQAMLAPMQPIANLGDSIANVKLSVTRLTLGDVKFTLVPVEGGLQFSAEFGALDVGANAAYGGTLVIDGSTSVRATADKVTIAGTLTVTPNGTSGFTVAIASPRVATTNLRLNASGLVGAVLDLVNDNLQSTVADIATSSAEQALTPMINQAFGTLAGEQRFDVLGRQLEMEASPAAVAFSPAGAQVTINLAIKIAGSEGSRGFIYTPNGTPDLDLGNGVQVGLADDLINEMLAEVHALGLLDIHLEEDVGVFDTLDIKLLVPPMISANAPDGALHLVLGDMIASLSNDGDEIIRAAINAQVDLQAKRGGSDDEIALEFGRVGLVVNLLDTETGENDAAGITDAAAAGIDLQLASMSQFLVKVPVPSVAGVSLDSLSLRGDSGYLVMAGRLR